MVSWKFFGEWVNRKWPIKKIEKSMSFLCDGCKQRYIERNNEDQKAAVAVLFWFFIAVIVMEIAMVLIA